MKQISYLLLLLALTGANASIVGDARLLQEGAFVFSVTGGVARVEKDILQGVEEESLYAPLKEVWKDCYAALLSKDVVTVSKYMKGDIPSTLTVTEPRDGVVRILTVSKQGW